MFQFSDDIISSTGSMRSRRSSTRRAGRGDDRQRKAEVLAGRTASRWCDDSLRKHEIKLDLPVTELCARGCGELAHGQQGQYRQRVPDLLGDEKLAWNSLEKLGADLYDGYIG
eukprot:16176581-Heterocapsa_arctica.AAC.1